MDVGKLLAAIEETERIAREALTEASVEHWTLTQSWSKEWEIWGYMRVARSVDPGAMDPKVAAHVLKHGPAAVLRRCAADRRQVARHYPERRSGYNPDDDDTPGAYGIISQACAECGSQDLAVRWPCPTLLDVASAYGLSVEKKTT